MNGRILSFEGHAHRDVERLLPWYANATLDDDETAQVERHLADCASCRAELAAVRAVIDANDAMQPADDPRDADRAWSHMRQRLHAARRAPSTRFDLGRVRDGWNGSAPWMRIALAAQCAAVVVLAAFLLRTEPAPQPQTFHTLSATPSPVSSQDTLLVVFDPRLTDAQLRELLGANHARIVDGPNATGAFLVATPPGQAEPVRNALRASPGVAMAERLAPPE
ncbi:zf-HC2 domain-containing protein [Lysobacter sp. A6]|uniref:Zf-HC2 domain-containing protein n=1 Tax=Noviluteimonas lactosilytica TaxID=2888523 RepID=A0ABS8JLC0_9GAMM|nr:zf-HC2 domain-containing protein [Lysobacter lactosilyticus]MCC8364418.1 zf-HC2 domain-containing protein [Lysobacter lactosilyticus]